MTLCPNVCYRSACPKVRSYKTKWLVIGSGSHTWRAFRAVLIVAPFMLLGSWDIPGPLWVWRDECDAILISKPTQRLPTVGEYASGQDMSLISGCTKLEARSSIFEVEGGAKAPILSSLDSPELSKCRVFPWMWRQVWCQTRPDRIRYRNHSTKDINYRQIVLTVNTHWVVKGTQLPMVTA